ncbi:MAG: hypothetical protein P1U87_17900, partial [Verrucomicrobiales bacterium]|nr:hypothetical protein [Verrucomicrobiales bacterium]
PAEWSEKLAKTPPLLVLQRGFRNPKSDELTWERLSPGHYSVRTEVRESEPVRGAVQIGSSALPFGPIVAGASAEWQFDRDRVSELRATSRTSGGGELLELTDAWRKPPAPGYEPIRNWFFLAALLLFLFEAFVTRTGWKLPFFQGRENVRKIAKEEKRRSNLAEKPASSEPDSSPPPSSESEADPQEDSKNRRNRFSRAKKRQ